MLKRNRCWRKYRGKLVKGEREEEEEEERKILQLRRESRREQHVRKKLQKILDAQLSPTLLCPVQAQR
jgi:hypothetical protein